MTTIHFHYTDSYNNPSRGSLAFMPHRRHAANETEILPKPFTIPLLNGEVTVNLQPNSSSWVWIITEYFEGVSKSFYTTVPDRDGVMEHTELVHISPSSIPAPYDAVEPAWWAEMRQYKQTVSDTLLQSGEALTEAQTAIEVGRESIERTQHNASVAGAYAEQSRESSYEARDYRDEAEQWRNEAQEHADRAATGPESAAARAETAADRAETSENRARDYEDESRTHASNARASETAATGAASTATERAGDARNEANRSEAEANRAKGYADELMDGPREYVEQSREARDDARDYATDAQTHATTAQTHANTAGDAAQQANTSATQADNHRELSDNILNQIIDYRDQILDNNIGFAVLKQHVGETVTDAFEPLSFQTQQEYGGAVTIISSSAIRANITGWYTVSGAAYFAAPDTGRQQLRLNAGENTVMTTVNYRNASLSMAAAYVQEGETFELYAYSNESLETHIGVQHGSLRVSYLGQQPSSE